MRFSRTLEYAHFIKGKCAKNLIFNLLENGTRVCGSLTYEAEPL